jgi:hypothetical protein
MAITKNKLQKRIVAILFEIFTAVVSGYCYNENNIDNTGQGQSRAPDRHPVVFAAHAGDDKTDANATAECGNGQEGALVEGWPELIRVVANSVTHTLCACGWVKKSPSVRGCLLLDDGAAHQT